MEPNPRRKISPTDGLRLLRSYNQQWESMIPLKTTSISFPEVVKLFDLVDGIFARAIPSGEDRYRGLEFYTLPSANDGDEWVKKEHKDLGCNIIDFAIDPSQDLLVLMEPFT